MRKYIVAWVLLALAVTARADPEFVKTLPTDEFTAAGLQKLTPEELAKLEALVQRFKSGEVATVRQQAAAQVTVSQEEAQKKIVAAESKAAAAEAKAKAAEQKVTKTAAKAEATPAKKEPSWFSALLTLNHASQKPEKEQPLESRLMGDFVGWGGRTVFTLENGTRWRQQNPTEVYPYGPPLHSPKVKVLPAMMGGFWLEIEGVNMNVRVVPVELPAPKQGQ